MKANELRIGNFVWEENGAYPPSVTYLTAKEIYLFESDCEHAGEAARYFQPIKLTPEWLEKFGFEKSQHEGELIIKVDIWEFSFDENGFELFTVDSYETPKYKIQYVHQLQNLYFALTGEELTIKNAIPSQS